MSPQEKAQELVGKFNNHILEVVGELLPPSPEYPEKILSSAKKAATATADEIIATKLLIKDNCYFVTPSYKQYWEEVKECIEKIELPVE